MTAYLQTLFQFTTYKRKQGRVARQATLVALLVVAAAGSYSLHKSLELGGDAGVRTNMAVAIGVFLAGCWASFRLIQFPKFAEFLIAVEQEMNKVSWPSRSELFKASLVVILTIFVFAVVLFAYDLLWKNVLGAVQWVAGRLFG